MIPDSLELSRFQEAKRERLDGSDLEGENKRLAAELREALRFGQLLDAARAEADAMRGRLK